MTTGGKKDEQSGPESALHTHPSLLLRIRDAQDAASWRTFVDTYAPLVYPFGRQRGLQDADADLAQEVMVEAARCLRTFAYQPERGRFRDWLGTLTRRKLSRFFARQRRPETEAVEEIAVEPGSSPPDPEWVDEFNARVLRVALDRIRPHFEAPTWRAFERVWLDNQPAAVVAGELATPLETIYLAKSRVLKRLREEVQMLADDIPHCIPLR